MEKLYIYTTNRRCWFSYKNMSLTGKYHHKSCFLMITWKLLLVTAVILGIEMLGFSGIKAWFRPREFCGKYLSVGSVSLVGLRGSGSIPGHPGWQFTSRWQSPTPFPIQIRLENGFRIDFPIFLLLLYRCNIDPAYRMVCRGHATHKVSATHWRCHTGNKDGARQTSMVGLMGRVKWTGTGGICGSRKTSRKLAGG